MCIFACISDILFSHKTEMFFRYIICCLYLFIAYSTSCNCSYDILTCYNKTDSSCPAGCINGGCGTPNCLNPVLVNMVQIGNKCAGHINETDTLEANFDYNLAVRRVYEWIDTIITPANNLSLECINIVNAIGCAIYFPTCRGGIVNCQRLSYQAYNICALSNISQMCITGGSWLYRTISPISPRINPDRTVYLYVFIGATVAFIAIIGAVMIARAIAARRYEKLYMQNDE
jgi:hypothetical protein